MIAGSLKLAFLFYVALTILYFLVSVYSRSVRRETLEKTWDADPDRVGLPAEARAAHIDAGMVAYDRGLKKRLLWLIYVVPTLGLAGIIYVINWY